MGNVTRFTQEERQAIFEAYNGRKKTLENIAKEFGTNRGSVVRIATQMGAVLRRPRKNQNEVKNGKTCPKCHKTIDIKGALYCCFCGADIRSEKELLIDRINGAMRKTLLCPEAIRDEMQRLFVDIKTELSKEVPG
jgi:hypothetical protein